MSKKPMRGLSGFMDDEPQEETVLLPPPLTGEVTSAARKKPRPHGIKTGVVVYPKSWSRFEMLKVELKGRGGNRRDIGPALLDKALHLLFKAAEESKKAGKLDEFLFSHD